MAYEDYAPVTADDEEERRRQQDYPIPRGIMPSPLGTPTTEPTIKPSPLGTGTTEPYFKPSPLGMPRDMSPTENIASSFPAVAPKLVPQRPQWKDYAPAEPHGWSKFGHFAASLIPATNRFFNEMPEKQAEQKYKTATEEYEAPGKEAQAEATTKETQARAGKEAAETEAIKNPQPKVGTTPGELTMHDMMTGGPNGTPRINPDTQKPYTYPEAYQFLQKAGTEAKRVPVGNDSAKQYNDSILRELNINPKTAQKAIPPEYEVKPNDTDAEAKEKLQRAKDLVGGATGQQKIVVQQGQYGSTRLDKSYDLSAKRLDETRKPVDDTVRRMGRLVDTLNQHSPQADALVAPELLTVMAGGQGSGLRMNEAEIARIVGGRSVWENLKASIQHWSTNPDDARSITPDQDRQIRSLIDTVHQKLLNKQKILDKANEDLLDAQDVTGHRKIVSEAQKALDAIDGQTTTEGNKEPPRPAHVPANYVYKENGPKGKGWYKP